MQNPCNHVRCVEHDLCYGFSVIKARLARTSAALLLPTTEATQDHSTSSLIDLCGQMPFILYCWSSRPFPEGEFSSDRDMCAISCSMTRNA